jgi:hypothetical protein
MDPTAADGRAALSGSEAFGPCGLSIGDRGALGAEMSN